jgi:hypothetical protein
MTKDDESDKTECPICCEEYPSSVFFGCNRCQSMACENCQKSYLLNLAKSGRKIRSTCLNQRCGFFNPHVFAPFRDEVQSVRPKYIPLCTKMQTLTQLIALLEVRDKTPCCGKDFTTDKCMVIHCQCNEDVIFCGFCGRYECDVDQHSIDDHVCQCRQNPNPVQRLGGSWFKSPYPRMQDFDFHKLTDRIQIVNAWLHQYYVVNGRAHLDELLRDNTQQLLDAVGSIYIKDKEKTILYVETGRVNVRFVHKVSALFPVLGFYYIKELPVPADERENRIRALSVHVRELWERLGANLLTNIRYNFELFDGFTDQLLALSEQRMVHLLTIAVSIVEDVDEPTILFSTTASGMVRL